MQHWHWFSFHDHALGRTTYDLKRIKISAAKSGVVHVDALGNLAMEILDKALIRVFKSAYILKFLNI